MNSRKSRKVLNSISLSLSFVVYSSWVHSRYPDACVPIWQPAAKNVSLRTGNFSGAFENLAESGIRHDRLVFCTSSFSALPLLFQPSVFPAPTTLGARIAQRTVVDKLATASRQRLLLFFSLSFSAHRTSSDRGFSRIWTQG